MMRWLQTVRLLFGWKQPQRSSDPFLQPKHGKQRPKGQAGKRLERKKMFVKMYVVMYVCSNCVYY